MIELLSPAGSMEALKAAVQNGANAVYLGCGTFNARQSAKNFTPQTLSEAVKYCHVRGVAVHLTLILRSYLRRSSKLGRSPPETVFSIAMMAASALPSSIFQ